MVAPKTSYEYEVDVDAILDQQSSDEDEEYDDNYLRNLDYILNESSSSSYSSPKSLQNDTKMKDFDEQLQRQQSNDYEKEEKEDDSSVIDSNLDSDNPKEAGILEEKVSDSTKRSVFREFGSLSLSDRFPGLAANFKLSPKPGAALAAAAAASRPKRNYSEEMSFNDSTEEVVVGDSQGDNSSLEKCNDDLEILQGNSEACSETGEVELKQKSEDVEVSEGNGENSIEVSSQVELGSEGNYDALNGDSGMADSSTEDRESISRNSDENIIINIDNVRDAQEGAQIIAEVQHEKDMHGQNGIVEVNDDRETSTAFLNEIVEALPEDGASFEALPEDVNAFGEKEIKAAEEIVDVDVKIEDHKHGQTKKKTGKKSSKSNNMSPLELAEEREKIEASSALHWEEGAASQPMRLEGIKRGPPAIGHLHVESISHLSNLFSSSAFKRDHGSPECLAVHLNFISVGLSRGSVFVFSSKYSPNSDNIDSSKVVCLNPPTETSRSAVSSMCFNQQGDMLLVGYGSGSLILWEPPKATPSKIITANHTSAVVQTMFLSQDLQNARQFKAISGDCKGNAFIHTISVVPLFRVFNVVSQCLLDSNSSGKALCISPLLGEYSHVGPPSTGHGVTALTPASLGDIMGGFVGSDTGKKHLSDVSHSEEGGGLVNFVSQHLILVFRLVQNPVCVASLTRPDGIREGAIPYTSWRPSSNKKESVPRNKTANNTSSGNAEHSSLTSMNEGAATKSSHDSEELDNSPFLAIAWDKKVLVTQLIKSELKVVREWNLDCTALGVAWLEDQMLAILNSKGQLCLFTKEGLELDRRKLGSEDGGESAVIYHTHFINSFGNPEKAYHNSMTVRGSVLYLLGPNTVFRSRLLPWNERIKALQNAGDWMSALKMAMDLYDGNTLGVIGLPKILDSLREAIMPFLLQLLSAYVDEAFSYISLAFSNQHDETEKQTEGKKKEVSIAVQIKEQFARVGGVAIEFCVHIKRTDVLFDEVFSKFLSVQHGGTFLELLEPYILKDMLGFLPPEVMQALVEHYSEKGWLQRIEQCVLHMDIASLDFNQVVKLCKEHELYSALIYLFNRGLDDFKAPLEELLLVAQDQQRPDAKAFGYKLLVYLKYCFLGLAFPPGHGHIPLERLPSLREELLRFLLQKSSARNVKNRKTSDSNNQMQSALLYLLSLDTHATLFVLKCAFSDDPFSAKDVDTSGLLHESHLGKEINESVQENRGLQLAQSLVDALIEIIEMCLSGIVTLPSSEETKDKCYENNWTLKSGMQILIHFIACFVANKYATVPKAMLITILEHLGVKAEQIDIGADDGSKKEILRAHENLMLALLKVVPESDWDKSFVLKLAENSKFYQVSGYIYELREQCSAALECYIKDLDHITYAFAFASNTLIKMEVEKSSLLFYFRSEVLKRMPELIQAHREAAFLLVLEHFNKENQEIISGLSGHPQILFLYLKTLINVLSHGLLNYPSLPSEHNTIFSYFGFKGLGPSKELSEYMKRTSNLPALLRQNSIEVTDDIAESYLELLCQYEPKSVLSFLESFENYRVEYCLKLCQDYGVTDAAAFLLERVGDVGSALTLIICDIGKKIEEMDSAVAYYFSKYSATRGKMQVNDFLTMPEVSAVHNILRMAVGLCQRNTLRLDPQESEFLWFRLLDVFSEPLQDLYNCEKSYGEGNKYRNCITDGANGRKISSVSSRDISNWKVIGVGNAAYFLRMIFTHFVGEIAEGMMGHIPLPIIMGKLLSDIGSQEFGDLKPTILGMLGTCGYEQTILCTAKSLIEDDTYYNLCILKKGASHAYSPKNTTCCICGRSLAVDSFGSGICFFSCGHSAHFQCQIPDQAAHKSNHVVVCPICMPKRNSSKGRSKLIATHNKILRGSHESVAHSSSDNSMLEKQYGLRQQSRFEILSTLKKREKSLDSGSLPSLRLAPPLVYHERKTQKISPPEMDIKIDNKLNAKSMESLQAKSKSAIQLPLTNSIFGSKKRKQ